jgi:hypothetical protein
MVYLFSNQTLGRKHLFPPRRFKVCLLSSQHTEDGDYSKDNTDEDVPVPDKALHGHSQQFAKIKKKKSWEAKPHLEFHR